MYFLIPLLPVIFILAPILAEQASLHFNGDGKFKIAIFSDLHYGEDENSFGIEQDVQSERLMRHVLQNEQPDFVVLNGDLITGENTFASNSTKYVDKIVKPLVEADTGWASTYGNHDSKFNLSREDVLKEEMMYHDLSYTQHGPSDTDGVTNYALTIYAHPSMTTRPAGQAPLTDIEKPVALLYFLDSRGGSQYDSVNNDNIPNFVTPATAGWLKQTHKSFRARFGLLPSLLFVHIPMQAFLDLQMSTANVSGSHYPGMNADEVARQGDGAVNETCCDYTGQDIPFMRVLLEMEGLHSIYAGHDHGDAWCGLWPEETRPSSPSLNQGPNFASNGRPFLCFCKHSGFGGYGKWNRGARIIDMTLEGGGVRVDSWVRMQWGAQDVVTSVGLNNTYGRDVYETQGGGWHAS